MYGNGRSKLFTLGILYISIVIACPIRPRQNDVGLANGLAGRALT
jgi:hypothetical protein